MYQYLVLVLIILSLVVISGRLYGTIVSQRDDAMCHMSAFSKELELRGTVNEIIEYFGARTHYEFSCPAQTHYISQLDHQLNPADQSRVQSLEERGYQNIDPELYNFEKFLATEIESCWAKTGHRELFPVYARLLKGEGGRNWIENYVSALETGSVFPIAGPPRFCVVCSRIIFDPEMTSEFGDEYDAVEYLKNHRASREDQSVFELVSQGRNQSNPFFTPDDGYTYSFDTPHAVVYFKQHEYDRDFMNQLQTRSASALIGTYVTRRILIRVGISGAVRAIGYGTSAVLGGVTFGVGTVGGIVLTEVAAQGIVMGIDYFFDDEQVTRHYPGYGVAIVPYMELNAQCDYIANNYGDVR